MPDTPSNHTGLPPPPELAEKLLSRLLQGVDPNLREAVLGDLAEAYYGHASRVGYRQARRWYWGELLRSAPALFHLTSNALLRSKRMKSNLKLAVLGLALILPSLVLVTSGVLQTGFGSTGLVNVVESLGIETFLFSPALILGGLGVALVINLVSVLRVQFQLEAGILVSTIQVRGQLLNLGLIGLSGLLLASILLYAVTENFLILPR
ncbi:MAG TPA: permease prefix domain 2-containing transporter [Anaerolineales bacterium]